MRMQSDSKWIDGRRTGSLFRKTVYFIYLTLFLFRFFVFFFRFFLIFFFRQFHSKFRVFFFFFFVLPLAKLTVNFFEQFHEEHEKHISTLMGPPVMYPFSADTYVCNYPGDISFAYSPAARCKYEILMRNSRFSLKSLLASDMEIQLIYYCIYHT